MSTFLGPVIDIKSSVSPVDNDFKPKLFNNSRKTKENLFKPKCRKELKKKLKKYRLRRDGQEDPEVLDVSQNLVSVLKIKSPNNNIIGNGTNNLEDDLRPKNYLFKMGRKKQGIKKKESDEGKAVVATKEQNGTILEYEKPNNKKRNSDFVSSKSESNTKGQNNTKDKKQTNAFALMMDSRNKSIGSNSPGKDKVVDEFDQQDINERKNMKAKRNLLLQKMAEAKGALKNKEIEEYKEKCIQKKMEKRTERLKNMIKTNESKQNDKSDRKLKDNSKVIPTNNNQDVTLTPKRKEFKIVNIFNNHVDKQNIPIAEVVTKEEEEFLKKLSPSLKKKENMLCYFKKVEKEHNDCIIDSADEDNKDDSLVIKVKLKSKRKNKLKRKKLSLNKAHLSDELVEVLCDDDNATHISSEEVKDANKSEKSLINLEKGKKSEELAGSIDIEKIRPRRNVKRPAKYVEDMQILSSDDDLHIFTPKKKKHAVQNTDERMVDNIESQSKQSVKVNKETKITIKKVNPAHVTTDKETKKPTKLAPIFAAKPQLDAAALEAKQKFLSSGVPDKLKKIIEKQSFKSTGFNNFHIVVHVQQNPIVPSDKVAKIPSIYTQYDSDDNIKEPKYESNFFNKSSLVKQPTKVDLNLPYSGNKTQVMLQKMKQIYPKFPVYRTYRLLREKSRGEFKDCSYLDLDNSIEVINGIIDINNETPDRLSWTDKYKSLSSKQIIGNFETIKELKKWLISWTENDDKSKKKNVSSDSSDFYYSDTDSKDSMKSTNNLLVLTGPVGSGKTSLVYAVAAELAIKVLEVNASSKRTGKIMLQDLQEATQSHKVNRGKSSQEITQRSQEIKCNEKTKLIKKRGRPKKYSQKEKKKTELTTKNDGLSQPSSSQDSVRTCMSLILIDDADIVFDQDDGFCSAIVQLVQCSKRPVILITSSKSCPHLQRFFQCAKIIHTRPFVPKTLGTWLDIMCLVDSGTCWPGLGAKSLDYFNGDIRKTINFLHFHASRDTVTDDEGSSQNIDDKIKLEDENSNMSWSDREGTDGKEENSFTNCVDNKVWQYFMNEETSLLHFTLPVNVFKVWWNMPRFLITPIDPKVDDDNRGNNPKSISKNEIDIISNVADMISIADYFGHSRKSVETELISVPWVDYETDSVSEQENFDKYDRNSDIIDEISHSLLSRSISKAQSDLELELQSDLQFPEFSFKRERSRIVSRHNNITSFLNPSAALDRRALALDYWSGCRSICRVEKTKTDCNTKRNNRFCHYLKSVNILCKSDSFDKLIDSLNCKDENNVS